MTQIINSSSAWTTIYEYDCSPTIDDDLCKEFIDALENGSYSDLRACMCVGTEPPATTTIQQLTAILIHQLKKDDHVVAEWALKHGAKPDAKSQKEQWLLAYLASKGDSTGIELLIRYGATVDIPDDVGMTPLFYAMEKGQFEAANLLIEKGASETTISLYGMQPRYHAFFEGHITDYSTLSEYNQAFFYYKIFCHATGTTTKARINGVVVKGESSHGTAMWHLFDQAFSHVINRKGEEYTTSPLEKIAEAYSFAISNFQNLEAFAKRIQSRQLTFVDAGWDIHAVTLLFIKHYLVICNRGDQWHDNEYLPIVAYRIDNKKVTLDILEKIGLNTHQTKKVGAHFLYSTLPKYLQKKGKSLATESSLLIEKLVSFPPQRLNICGLISPLTVGQLTYAILNRKEDSPMNLQKTVKKLGKDIQEAIAQISWRFLRDCPLIELEEMDQQRFEKKYA